MLWSSSWIMEWNKHLNLRRRTSNVWKMDYVCAHCASIRANKQRDQWELFHIIGIIFYLSKHTYIFVNLVASPMKTTMKKNYSFLKNVLLEAFRESCFVSPCSPIDLCFSGRICVSVSLGLFVTNLWSYSFYNVFLLINHLQTYAFNMPKFSSADSIEPNSCEWLEYGNGYNTLFLPIYISGVI